jgi:predicted metal-dependent hydrolase
MLKLLGAAPKKPVSELKVAYQGASFRVALKRVALARRLTLRVRSATHDVVLTMPAGASLRNAQEFAQNHAGWIAERLARLPQRQAFLPGGAIPFRGVEHNLRRLSSQAPEAKGRGPVWVDDQDGVKTICATGDALHFERRIADFLRREARLDLEAAVRRHAAAIGRAPVALSLRDTSSRWGSCSAKGALNFSWRLILAPPFVLDYLAAHETAHLRHHDHSEKFWSLTKSLCPQTEKAEAWLKAHGAKLHSYGRKARAAAGDELSAG